MIKKLKRRVIALSMVSLSVFLAVIVTGMNVLNYLSVVREADETLTVLAQDKGSFHGPEGERGDKPVGELPNGEQPGGEPFGDKNVPPHLSPELPYESRYFSVILDKDGTVLQADTGRITAVDDTAARSYADRAWQSEAERGFVGEFRFVRLDKNGTSVLTFLDCGRKLAAYRTFLVTGIGMAAAGLLIAFFVIAAVAGRIVQPIAESYEKQKRFVTDAGHEIKTPLTVIQANADLWEMEFGQNEYVREIRQQTKRLTALTNDLVYLARMEETEHALPMVEFPLSDAVQETVTSFKALALSQQKELRCEVSPLLSIKGNDKTIRQLVSILMDNALKYSPPDSVIAVRLEKQNKTVSLTVENAVETVLFAEDLKRVFDRFYRADPSRNSQTGGHGIGLSMAKAIVQTHGGRIHAWTKDGHTFHITAVFPL